MLKRTGTGVVKVHVPLTQGNCLRNNFCLLKVRMRKFPSFGGVARSAGVVKSTG
jgi:hypothetical protein